MKLKLDGLLSIILIFFINSFVLGQVDTIYNDKGNIVEIGASINGQKQGKWLTYHENGILESEGFYKNNKRTGKWTWYHDNEVLCSKEKYKNDRLKKGKFWDREGSPTDISEIMSKPEYQGGMDAFRKMVADNLKYPEDAQANGVSGRVFIQFNIDKDGKLVDSQVIRGVHPDLDKEALRVVRLSEKWTPGTFHGKKIKVSFTFPVVFMLE